MAGTSGTTGRRPRRGVPRGPPEWGKILYEPDWASSRRFQEAWTLLPNGLVILAGVLVAAQLPLIALLSDAPWNLQATLVELPLLAVGAIIAWVGLAFFEAELCLMPLRVYEAGLTERMVPLGQGIRRRESLVAWDRVVLVKVRSELRGGQPSRCIVLDYRGGDGEVVHEDLGLEDPHTVLRLLAERAPAALDASATPFLGKGPGRLPGVPLPARGGPPTLTWLLLPFFLVLMVTWVPLVGTMVPLTDRWDAFIATAVGGYIVVLGTLSTTLVAIAFMLCERSFKWAILARAKLAGDALELPRPGLARLMLRTRRELPVSEVVEVRRFLDPGTLSQLARMRTSSGEEFEVRGGLMHALSHHPSFGVEDYRVVNTGPIEVPGRPVMRRMWARAAAVFLVPWVAAVAIWLGLAEPHMDFLEDLSIVSFLGLELTVLALMVALLPFAWAYTRWRWRADSLEASGSGVRFKTFLGLRRRVRADRIRWIEVREGWLLGFHIAVRTRFLTVTLPMEAHDALLEAGYGIEDPGEVLAGL